jgi:predicted RNA-binding protein YlxR (DUF448 family)
MLPKRSLIRLVKPPEGDVAIDTRGDKDGRGAYLCRSIECVRKARKAKRLEKVFRRKIPGEIYDEAEQLALRESSVSG